jgi:hypothetical protein
MSSTDSWFSFQSVTFGAEKPLDSSNMRSAYGRNDRASEPEHVQPL